MISPDKEGNKKGRPPKQRKATASSTATGEANTSASHLERTSSESGLNTLAPSTDAGVATACSNNHNFKTHKYRVSTCLHYPLIPSTVTNEPFTAHECLSLLDAIKRLGLGNWADVAEEFSEGNNNGNKGRKIADWSRFYFNDWMGRWGEIVPREFIGAHGDINGVEVSTGKGKETQVAVQTKSVVTEQQIGLLLS